MSDTSKDTSNKQKSRPPRTKKSRWTFRRAMLIILLLLLGLAGAAYFIPTTRWVQAEGYVITDNEAEIRPSVQGAIDTWYVESGDRVTKGQKLIQLKCEVHRAAMEQANSQQKVAEAKLADLLKDQELAEAKRKQKIYRAERELARLEDELRRMEESKTGAISPREIMDTRLRVDVAKSKLAEMKLDPKEAMQKEEQVLREQIESTKKAVRLHAAEVELRIVHSAVDGVVQLHRFEPGEVVKPEHVLGQVFDTSCWIVKLTVNERAIAFVQVGQPVQVELAAYPAWRHGYLAATVKDIKQIVTPRATGDGVFYVEAELQESPNGRLHPGMRVTANIDTGQTNWLLRLFGW